MKAVIAAMLAISIVFLGACDDETEDDLGGLGR